MVTSLGTLSITYAELKQLIKSLKVEDNAEPHPYTSALMQAMSGQCQPLHQRPDADHVRSVLAPTPAP